MTATPPHDPGEIHIVNRIDLIELDAAKATVGFVIVDDAICRSSWDIRHGTSTSRN